MVHHGCKLDPYQDNLVVTVITRASCAAAMQAHGYMFKCVALQLDGPLVVQLQLKQVTCVGVWPLGAVAT